MSLELALGILPVNPIHLDSRYGPWANLAAAKAGVPAGIRMKNLTVGVVNGSVVDEYWWKNGTTDSDLELKSYGGASIIPITYANIITAITGSTLLPGGIYKITDRGDRGIYVQAISSNELNRTGIRKMLCPAVYAITTDDFSNDWIGVWHNTKTVAADQLTIWGGKVWKNLTGVIGTATNESTLDGTNWSLISKSSFANHEYVELLFGINYDVLNDWIDAQWDHKRNKFGAHFYLWTFIYGYTFNPVDISDWNFDNENHQLYNNQVVGVWNNAYGFAPFYIYGNRSSYSIFNNKMNGAISDNSNMGDISYNTDLTGISQNSNMGAIVNNNLNFNGISNNSNRGSIDGNTISGPINDNSCGSAIISNSGSGGGISFNTNGGGIDSNTNTGVISQNRNVGSISFNSNTGDITLNTNAGSIGYNSTTSHITKNRNSGDIWLNANHGIISDNHNAGKIQSFPHGGTNYTIVNNHYRGDMIWLAGYGTMTQNIDGKNFKTISGTSYTLLPWDHNNLYTNAADVTVTIPTGLALPHSSVHTQMNTGVVIFTGTAAVNSKGGADRTSGQYSPAALYATATNTYILGGDITV